MRLKAVAKSYRKRGVAIARGGFL